MTEQTKPLPSKSPSFGSAYAGETHFSAAEAARMSGYGLKTTGEEDYRVLKRHQVRAKLENPSTA